MLRKLFAGFSRVRQFSELETLNTYLSANRYPYVMVYFIAKWNPACRVADEHVNLIAENFT